MRVLDGEQLLVRIFIGDSDKWHHQPLDRALIERLRREGFAGTTVIRGVAGFGATSVIHTAHLVDLSADLPVLIEVVDLEEKVRAVVPELDAMVSGGLITLERLEVVVHRTDAGPSAD
jgi:PII-like signaling protein